jgi:hypothetical protein
MSVTLLPGQTRSVERYRCPDCAVIAPAIVDEVGPFCGGTPACGAMLFDTNEVVGQGVYLHHAKSASRKSGRVVKVSRTRMVIEVAALTEHRTSYLTTRRIDDPDIRWVRT